MQTKSYHSFTITICWSYEYYEKKQIKECMDIKCGLMDQNTPRHFFSYEKKC
jgi:hypothetical protein